MRGVPPLEVEFRCLGLNRAQEVVRRVPRDGDVPCGCGRQDRRLGGQWIGGDVPTYGVELPMAAVVTRGPGCDADDAENRLAHHDVEVVPTFVWEGSGGHDGPHDIAVVVTTDLREDE